MGAPAGGSPPLGPLDHVHPDPQRKEAQALGKDQVVAFTVDELAFPGLLHDVEDGAGSFNAR